MCLNNILVTTRVILRTCGMDIMITAGQCGQLTNVKMEFLSCV